MSDSPPERDVRSQGLGVDPMQGNGSEGDWITDGAVQQVVYDELTLAIAAIQSQQP